MVMKAEKSHDVPTPSARQRPGKGKGVLQSKSKGLRTRSSDAWRQEQMDATVHEEKDFTLPSTHVLFRPSVDWMEAMILAHVGEGRYSLLSLRICLPAAGHPLAHSSWHIKLTITVSISFGLLNTIPWYEYTTFWFTFSSIWWAFGVFLVCAIMNKAAINIPVKVFW